jgi:hypothetical protein
VHAGYEPVEHGAVPERDHLVPAHLAGARVLRAGRGERREPHLDELSHVGGFRFALGATIMS